MDERVVALLTCPFCRSSLQAAGGELKCPMSHVFGCNGPYVTFEQDHAESKYDESYSIRYAFLWAYGYETRHSGLVESLYRSAGGLVAEALAGISSREPAIVDCGCGTGRMIADASRLAPSARLLGVDLSSAKLELAARILKGTDPVRNALPAYGFADTLAIAGRRLTNVVLAQANALALPVVDAAIDIVMSVNLLDRVPDPRAAVSEARRVLKPGGTLVLTTPLNWTTPELWDAYPNSEVVLRLVQECGFRVNTWFDQLIYREILDARGSIEEFTTLILSAEGI